MNERNKKEKVEEERRGGGKKGEPKCRASSSGQSFGGLKGSDGWGRRAPVEQRKPESRTRVANVVRSGAQTTSCTLIILLTTCKTPVFGLVTSRLAVLRYATVHAL